MAILNSVINFFTQGRIRTIEDYGPNAGDVQWLQLHNNLKKGAETLYGNTYRLGAITNYKQFAARVPLMPYESFMPYIDRMLRGERSVTWPGVVHWFAKSSGTTNAKSKFIPVTDDALHTCHYQGARDVMMLYASQHPDTHFFTGKSLALGGSKRISRINAESQVGDLSAILISNSPKWVNIFKTPDPEIALLDKWEEKLERITKATVQQDVTSIVGVPSWFLILIKHILKVTGKSNIQEVWPGLELFIHGGVNFTPYREQYKALAPNGINFMETYNASEGFFAIQNVPDDPGMLLMMDYGIFYEFVPLGELEKEHPQALTITDVELGVDYALAITTNGGLWRYLIGDTVRFTSLNPYKIIITGRTKNYMNAFGEEIMIDNAEKALAKACEATGAVISEYTAAPVFMTTGEQKGCHEWLVEFGKQPADPTLFRDILDKELQKINSDYEAKRYKDITLGPPTLTVAPPGLFFNWMKANDKLGGQNKVPRLHNNRDIIDLLKKMM